MVADIAEASRYLPYILLVRLSLNVYHTWVAAANLQQM